MSNSKLTRRQTLKVAGVAIAGGVAAFGYSPSPLGLTAEADSIVVGEVQRLESPKLLYLFGPSSMKQANAPRQMIPVKVSEATTFSRGTQGRVKGVVEFSLGDRVVAEGQWAGNLFVAANVMSLYYFVEGKITDRQSERLETTAGTVWLTADTEAFDTEGNKKSLDTLNAGDHLAATVWIEPTTGKFIALGLNVTEQQTH